MSIKVVLLIAAAAAVAGCVDTIIDPAPPGGARYVLRSIEGHPLPAEYSQNRDFHGLVVADTLDLRDDGTGTLHGAVAENATAVAQHQSSEVFTESSGNDISITFVCPINASLASCIAGPHFVGRVTEEGIVISRSPVMRAPLVFERVP